MKACAIDSFGDVEHIHIRDIPTPEPKENEVQIKVAYAALNPVDWKIVEGSLEKVFPYTFPLIPGWDAAGVVSAVGKNVTKFNVGDEVFACCMKKTVQWGTYAEYVCFDAEHTAKKPENISFAQAAAVPLIGLTAWQALFDIANLKKNQTILIHAGAGGVGSVAIELARIAGAKIYTTASTKNHAYVSSLGADVPIDYHLEDFAQTIKKLEPDGLDVIFDCVGYETLEKSYDLVKPGGHLISIVNKVDEEQAKKKNIHGAFMILHPDGEQLEKIGHYLNEGTMIPPHILEIPLSDAVKALKLSKQGHTKGKIVLKVSN